jgi:hypothetical protein
MVKNAILIGQKCHFSRQKEALSFHQVVMLDENGLGVQRGSKVNDVLWWNRLT